MASLGLASRLASLGLASRLAPLGLAPLGLAPRLGLKSNPLVQLCGPGRGRFLCVELAMLRGANIVATASFVVEVEK